MKMKRFVVGLLPAIHGLVAMIMPSAYREAMEATLLAEKEYGGKMDETKNEKRKLDEGNRKNQENKRF
ncbi:hypothetical protein Tco_0038723 [Tanacetum coccineum]